MSIWDKRPLVVGHRGGRGKDWPRENTIAAFDLARRQGAPAIELDVRPCSGGDAVVLHDPTLSRTTGGRDERRVCDVSVRQLRAMGVPALDDALSWAHACGVAVNVEMKHDAPDRVTGRPGESPLSRFARACGRPGESPLSRFARACGLVRATVRAVKNTGADVLLSSFDPLLLAIAAVLAPSLPRALLVHAAQPRWADVLQETMRRPLLGWLHLEREQVHRGMANTARTVARYKKRGLRLGIWTVNDPSEAVDLVGLGAASIITDVPGTILQALSRS